MDVNENENSNLQTKWTRIQSRLRAELGEDVFTSWFGRVELEAYNEGHALLSVPTRFLKNWLESHYAERSPNPAAESLKA